MDGRDQDIATLKSIQKRKDLTLYQKKQIELELSNIIKGVNAEKKAAYALDFYFKNHRNYVIIHDLRLVHEDRVAQIDHLIIDRFFNFYVLESKYVAEEIIINEDGEFSAKYQNKTIGIPSPIAQNQRHIAVLRSFLKSKKIKRPLTLGFRAVPNFENVITLSSNVKIDRPAGGNKVQDAYVMKIDNFISFIDKKASESSFKEVFQFAQLMFREELKKFAEDLASHHQALKMDWYARFGIVEPKSDEALLGKQSAKNKTKKLICAKCSDPIEFIVARFCWFNKKRFGGNTYCRSCQASCS